GQIPKKVISNKTAPTILIIEDNPDMRDLIRQDLSKTYTILEATNGNDGLAMALQKSPDLIITDVMMPKMGGMELCQKLKTHIITSHIPIIMLTAKVGFKSKLKGLEIGADDYLTKPFNARELKARVKNLIESRERLRKLFKSTTKIDPKKVTVTSMDEKFVAKLKELLENNYDDTSFNVPEMQKALAMGKTQLHRKIKSITGQSPGELLRNFRLRRAAQLIKEGDDDISQIAYSVGFNSLSYFSKRFKESFGIPPSEFREK
ncbi:MAG: response regulator, partial [Eudoraea sp.]|nr:response regulator [Eudoraea sp.]